MRHSNDLKLSSLPGFKLMVGGWIAGLVLFLAFWGTIGYVVFHFLGKYW